MNTDVIPSASLKPPPSLEQVARDLGVDLGTREGMATATICAQLGLNPFLKHIVLIKSRSGTYSPYITRDGLLHIAHRSGQLDGIEVKEPYVGEDKYWHTEVSIHRKDMRVAFTYPGRYPSSGTQQATTYGPEMAIKAAECHALRRAFDITGIPVLEESGQEWPEPVPSPSLEAPQKSKLASLKLQREVAAALTDLGIATPKSQLEACSDVTGRPIASARDLTESEATSVMAWALEQASEDLTPEALEQVAANDNG